MPLHLVRLVKSFLCVAVILGWGIGYVSRSLWSIRGLRRFTMARDSLPLKSCGFERVSFGRELARAAVPPSSDAPRSLDPLSRPQRGCRRACGHGKPPRDDGVFRTQGCRGHRLEEQAGGTEEVGATAVPSCEIRYSLRFRFSKNLRPGGLRSGRAPRSRAPG